MKKMRLACLLLVAVLLSVMLLPGLASAASKTTRINKEELTLEAGKSATLKVLNLKKNAKVKWTSSNKKIATVTSKGKVTAVKGGTCKITAKVGSKKYVCNVTVTEKPTITVNKTYIKMKVGEKKTVKVTYRKSGTIYWNTDGSGIVSPSWSRKWKNNTTKLTITANKRGITTVRLTNTADKAEAVITVEVEPDEPNINGWTLSDISDLQRKFGWGCDYIGYAADALDPSSSNYRAVGYISKALSNMRDAAEVANHLPEIYNDNGVSMKTLFENLISYLSIANYNSSIYELMDVLQVATEYCAQINLFIGNLLVQLPYSY